jgi:AcrR family transcriptional regulator
MQRKRNAGGDTETAHTPRDRTLLDAARRAITAHGYAGATLARIAAEAGVSRMTLHRRAVTKAGLLNELVAEATDDYRRAMWPALTGTEPAAERLRRALDALCDAAEQHLALLVALRAQADRVFHEREDDDGVTLTRSVFTEPLEKLLREGAGDGTLRTVDAPEVATLLFNLVGWTYVHMRTGHGWRPERAREATVEVVMRGLLAPA